MQVHVVGTFLFYFTILIQTGSRDRL